MDVLVLVATFMPARSHRLRPGAMYVRQETSWCHSSSGLGGPSCGRSFIAPKGFSKGTLWNPRFLVLLCGRGWELFLADFEGEGV